MARFTVRVELVDAVYEDYEILYEEMQRRNFTKTIFSDTGMEYHLPPAEYNRIGNYTASQTMTAVKASASITRKEFRILISESLPRKWFNLEEVRTSEI